MKNDSGGKFMNTAQPIRTRQELEAFMDYYKRVQVQPRNQLLIVMGLNTALRISDLLSLRWQDVYDAEGNRWRAHIILTEAKTGKESCIFVNDHIRSALHSYYICWKKLYKEQPSGEKYLFRGKTEAPISRVQAYRIVRKAAEACNLSGVISPHSLRKTFGYHAWKQGISPVLLMEIYHHSSYRITKRYLGIEQDDRDEVFRNICL